VVAIQEFNATPAWGYAPLQVELSWTILVPEDRIVQCEIDVDGDGNPEKTSTDCKQGTYAFTYSEGSYQPIIKVEDDIGNAVSKSIYVYSNKELTKDDLSTDVVFPEEFPSYLESVLEGDQLSLHFQTGATDSPVAVNQIVWLRQSHTLVRVLESLGSTAGTWSYRIRPAQVDEAIKSYRFGVVFDDSDQNGSVASALTTGDFNRVSSGLTIEGNGSVGKKQGWNGVLIKDDQGQTLLSVDVGAFVGFKVKRFFIDIDWFTVRSMELDMGLGCSAEFAAEFNSKLTAFNKKIPLPEVPLGVIPVGPLVLVANFKPVLSFKGQLGLNATFNASTEVFGGINVTYDGTNFDVKPEMAIKPVAEVLHPDITMDAYAQLKAGLAPGIGIKIFNVAGPFMSPIGYADIKANVNLFPDEEFCITAGASIEGAAGISAGLFGFDAEASVEVTFAEWEFYNECRPIKEVLGIECGNQECEFLEDACDCPQDCPSDCGDTCCASDEDCGTCPEDCACDVDQECNAGQCVDCQPYMYQICKFGKMYWADSCLTVSDEVADDCNGWGCSHSPTPGADHCNDSPCIADCTGRECGFDGCTGSCGECDVGTICDDLSGKCLPCPSNSCTENGWLSGIHCLDDTLVECIIINNCVEPSEETCVHGCNSIDLVCNCPPDDACTSFGTGEGPLCVPGDSSGGTLYQCKFDEITGCLLSDGEPENCSAGCDASMTKCATVVSDTTKPVVSNASAEWTGSKVHVTATITDNVGVTQAKVYYDKDPALPCGTVYGGNTNMSGGGSSYTADIPESWGPGPHKVCIKVTAWDAAGNESVGWTKELVFSVGDTTKPVVSNASAEWTGSKVHVTATITDNVGVTQAKVYYDKDPWLACGTVYSGNTDMSGSGSSYAADLPESFDPGPHTVCIKVTAWDAAGNESIGWTKELKF